MKLSEFIKVRESAIRRGHRSNALADLNGQARCATNEALIVKWEKQLREARGCAICDEVLGDAFTTIYRDGEPHCDICNTCDKRLDTLGFVMFKSPVR